MDFNIAYTDHARDAFPSERILRRSYHYCGCITICDTWGNVLCGVACLRVPAHRAGIVEPEAECRCCGAPMGNSDHCPLCGCEEYEERADCPDRRRTSDA